VERGSGVPPVPPRGRRRKYPLDQLQVGDSFVADCSYQTIHRSITHYLETECGGRGSDGCPEFIIERIKQRKVRVTRRE